VALVSEVVFKLVAQKQRFFASKSNWCVSIPPCPPPPPALKAPFLGLRRLASYVACGVCVCGGECACARLWWPSGLISW
jgi:hypothetical protein